MQRHTFTMVLVLTLFVAAVFSAAPAWAGEYGKCTASTQECLNSMTEMLKTSGWVGIEYEPMENGHLKILRVVPESPAQAAGLQPEDVLVAMYGVEFTPANEKKLKQVRKEWSPGQEVAYTILRNGNDKQIKLTLAPMPADVMAQYIGHHMLEHAQVADVAQAKP